MNHFQNIPHDPRIKRDDFRLPDFTRVLYASGKVREHWEPKVGLASRAWLELERELLVEGVRPSILIFVLKKDMESTLQWIHDHGFHFVVVKTSFASGSYRSFGGGSAAGKSADDLEYRIAVMRDREFIPEWSKAYAEGDDETIGRLLGYPSCCRTFFDDNWNDLMYRDLTIPAALDTIEFGIKPDWRSNILGRWTGVRLVSHMPCSFGCEASILQAEQALGIGHQKNIDGMNELERLLKMPYLYTCLHGIAEITTPVFKVSASSEATPERFEYRVEGTVPEMAASGKDFPFDNKQRNKITESKSFKKSIEAITSARESESATLDTNEINDILEKTQSSSPPKSQQKPLTNTQNSLDMKADVVHAATRDRQSGAKYGSQKNSNLWKMNGFSSITAMKAAHQPIVDAVTSKSVFDMGCGNGQLLNEIGNKTGAIVTGCDTNHEAIQYGGEHFGMILLHADMFKVRLPDLPDLTVILMAGRLTEVDPDTAQQLVTKIINSANFVVLYAYGDWLENFDDMQSDFEMMAHTAAGANKIIIPLDADETEGVVQLVKYQIMEN